MPPAVIAAAVGGAAALGGAAINKSATNKASAAAERAAAENRATQERIYNQTRSDLAPYNQTGVAANSALANYYGLGGGGQQSAQPTSGAVDPYKFAMESERGFGPGDPTYQGPALGSGGTVGAGAPQGGGGGSYAPAQPDYNAYLAANPDVAAYAAANPQEVAQYGGPEGYAAAHYQAFGQQEGRPLPTTGGTAATEGGAQPGPTFDPTGPARPDTGARPADYGAAPSFSSYFDPNPTQQYRDELQRTTRALNGAAGMQGSYFSGNRGLQLQDNADRLYRADEQNRFNRANSLYQTALGQFNTNRQFGDTNYDVDTARTDARFETDRGYTTGREDTRTNDLFRLSSTGLQAAGGAANAGQNFANQSTANNNNLATVQGNAAIAGANNTNALIGQAMQTYGLFGGNGNGSTAAGRNALSNVSANGWAW